MNQKTRHALIWAMMLLAGMMVFNAVQDGYQEASRRRSAWAFSDLLAQVDQGHVEEVSIRGRHIVARTRDGQLFHTWSPDDPHLVDRLHEKNVRIVAQPTEQESPSWWHMVLGWLPTLLFLGLSFAFYRQMQAGGNKALGFGKSRARMSADNRRKVTFKDVAGVDEARDELEEVVDFLKDPAKYRRIGGKIPRGVLLSGSPGTGKTLLARAVAGEADVPFFSISGSDFVEMFVGVGASRVRDMFEQARKQAPCIIFIDEIDAVGRHRGAGLGGGNDEREQTLNQLLVEMDGFEGTEGVIVIAATNRPDVLDPALLRPGRFDRQVVVALPDVKGREQILRVHMKVVPLAKDVDAGVLARGTPGFSGADLANLVNEGVLVAARQNKKYVHMSHFEFAKDKVMMGAERKSMVMKEEERRLTAYHEGGHAVVAFHMPHSDPIHKATIIPRGRALGMVMRLPEGDRLSVQKVKLEEDLVVAMGGRVAEELIFGAEHVTTGASSDIRMATDMARKMITEWGMSASMGPVAYGDKSQEVFLGHSVTQHNTLSDETALAIDKEIRTLVEKSYTRARDLLVTHMDQLHALAAALLEHETLTGEEVGKVLRGETLPPVSADASGADDEDKPLRPSLVPSGGLAGLTPEPAV